MTVKHLTLLLLFLAATTAFGQTPVRISSKAWNDLTASERAEIQKLVIVETLQPTTFGITLDNQAVDRSTQGTNAGSLLGGAVASATYVDRAIKSGDYSAKTHLGMLILGGILGSTLDSNGKQLYQFRYALRLGDGAVVYQDAFSPEPFRHPAGVCLLVPELALAPDQSLCSQTAQSLRKTYLAQAPSAQPIHSHTMSPVPREQDAQTMVTNQDALILCKLGISAPVRTTKEKCHSISGDVVNE